MSIFPRNKRTNNASADRNGLARRYRGQALVETALMLPVILILLLGAIDLGRAFFGWVSLHQAARIAANHASIDTQTTSADLPALIQTESDVMNCELGTPTLQYTSGGTVTTTPQLGDYAHVTLTCDFSLLTPLAGVLFGDPIPMTAVSTFPVRAGAVGESNGGGGNPPPPPEQCRTLPDWDGLSVAGARLAWESAGFFPGNFNTSGSDTDSVDVADITVSPLDPSCPDPEAIFNASVTVGTLTPDGSPPGPLGCEVIPNFIGNTIQQARDIWDNSNFTGNLLPPPDPLEDADAVVLTQITYQSSVQVASEPGVSCMDVTTDIEVTLGDPWPAAPPTPCQVPHLIDEMRPVGESLWYANSFVPGTFQPTSGNWKIKYQSLVGFSWVPCDTNIVVSQTPP